MSCPSRRDDDAAAPAGGRARPPAWAAARSPCAPRRLALDLRPLRRHGTRNPLALRFGSGWAAALQARRRRPRAGGGEPRARAAAAAGARQRLPERALRRGGRASGSAAPRPWRPAERPARPRRDVFDRPPPPRPWPRPRRVLSSDRDLLSPRSAAGVRPRSRWWGSRSRSQHAIFLVQDGEDTCDLALGGAGCARVSEPLSAHGAEVEQLVAGVGSFCSSASTGQVTQLSSFQRLASLDTDLRPDGQLHRREAERVPRERLGTPASSRNTRPADHGHPALRPSPCRSRCARAAGFFVTAPRREDVIQTLPRA